MNSILAFLSGKKTYLVGFVAAVFNLGAGLGWWDVEDKTWTAIDGLFVALLGMTIRSGVAKAGAAVPKSFLVGGLIWASTLLSPLVATAQTGATSKTLIEPDYTVGLVSLTQAAPGETGVQFDVTPGIGLGIAYSSVSSSNGVDWDVTDWSVACDPLYIERDVSGSLFWVPGIKGSVFNEYLQLYVGVKVGTLGYEASVGDRVEFKFGTSLTGIWDGVTGVVLDE